MNIGLGFFQRLALVLVSLFGLEIFCSGCGKYGVPLPPERFAPKKVRELEVTPTEQGIGFAWKAPEKNARGKELASIDGYRVYRREILAQSDIVDDTDELELLATIPDTHVVEREELRAAARAQGKPGRRINVDSKKLHFEYSDTSAVKGSNYLYQIVPFNQGDVEGHGSQEIFVAFNGEKSKVSKAATTEDDEVTTDESE